MSTRYADLHPGDRIVAVNGKTLPEPRVVDIVQPDRVRTVPPRRSSVEWWLYADQHEVDIEVPAPPPPPPPPAPEPSPPPAPPKKARKGPSRVVEGVTLRSTGGAHWESEDGRYGVQRESGVTFCDEAHPVKFNHDLIEAIKQRPHLYPPEAAWAVHTYKRGYHCPGGEEHSYPIWTTWAGDFLGDMADTMEGAIAILADAIRDERDSKNHA